MSHGLYAIIPGRRGRQSVGCHFGFSLLPCVFTIDTGWQRISLAGLPAAFFMPVASFSAVSSATRWLCLDRHVLGRQRVPTPPCMPNVGPLLEPASKQSMRIRLRQCDDWFAGQTGKSSHGFCMASLLSFSLRANGSVRGSSGFDFGQTLFDCIQLSLQRIGVALERLFFHSRLRLLSIRCRIHKWCGIPAEPLPARKPGGIEHIPPPASSAAESSAPGPAAASETRSKAAPGVRMGVPRCFKPGAVSGRPAGHGPHSQGPCSISSWHGCILLSRNV